MSGRAAIGRLLRPALPRIVSARLLGGGLGNQLFDYAAARTLADRSGARLVVDASACGTDPARPFCLDAFALRCELRTAGWSQDTGLGRRALRRLREDVLSARFVRSADDYGYAALPCERAGRAILRSHFLTPRFFRGNEAAIRADLRFVEGDDALSPQAKAWLRRIRSEANAIMLHIRRGDLLAPASAWLRLPDVERYMRSALERIRAAAGSSRVFAFTDDPAWSAAWLRDAGVEGEVVSTGEGDRRSVLEDFRLMMACRHFVVPNSAYSWWAAFLSGSDGLRVLPAVWDPRGIVPVDEVLMPGWIGIVEGSGPPAPRAVPGAMPAADAAVMPAQ